MLDFRESGHLPDAPLAAELSAKVWAELAAQQPRMPSNETVPPNNVLSPDGQFLLISNDIYGAQTPTALPFTPGAIPAAADVQNLPAGPANITEPDGMQLSPTDLQMDKPQESGDNSRPFEIVKFQNGDQTEYGALWKPPGKGPFPAIIYNHGSEQENDLDAAPQHGYGNVGEFYASHGFVCLIPLRQGHTFDYGNKPLATSDGELFSDRLDELTKTSGNDQSVNKGVIWQQQQEVDNKDVVAAVNWLKSQPFVNQEQMAMSGVSFGGIQTALTAEKGLGIKAFIPFAPGAMSWNSVPGVQDFLSETLLNSKAPEFLIQAQNDYSLGPSEVLGDVLDQEGAPNQHKVYPEFKPGAGHGAGHFGFATEPGGIQIWGDDVLAFLNERLGLSPKR